MGADVIRQPSPSDALFKSGIDVFDRLTLLQSDAVAFTIFLECFYKRSKAERFRNHPPLLILLNMTEGVKIIRTAKKPNKNPPIFSLIIVDHRPAKEDDSVTLCFWVWND